MTRSFILVCITLYSLNLYSQVNVAVNKPVTVDSETFSQPAWKAVDGLNYSNVNRWTSQSTGYPHWIEVNLEQEYRVESINFYTGFYGDNHPVYAYQLQSWTGSAWTDIVHRTNNSTPVVKEIFSPVSTSKIRLYASSGEGPSLMMYEIEIFASFNLPPTIDPVRDQEPVYSDEGTRTILLSGISDGDTSNVQTISVTATSSDPGIVSDPVIMYTQGDSTAVLQWTPGGPEGTATITLTVEDSGNNDFGGNNKKQISFEVKVRDPARNYAPSIDNIPDIYAFSLGESYQITLKGITDGDHNQNQELNLSAVTTGNDLIENLDISYIQGDSTGILQFNTTKKSGSTTIYVTLKDAGGTGGGGVDSIQISVDVIVTEKQDAVQITTDLQQKHQIIEGFGGFGMEKVEWSRGQYHSDWFINEIINDLGVSIIRIPVCPPSFEPQNDNNDPYSIDLDQFRENIYNGDDGKFFNYLKDLYSTGTPKLIASIWSPPAWMKSNNNFREGGILLTQYYQEFAEYVVAFIKMVKQEIGIDLYAISLQNEPTFWEPYASCQYTPRTYCDLIKVVGERFDLEGITTKLFYPEEVFIRENDIKGWMDTLNSDPDAREYVDIMAVHHYERDGIGPGETGGELWKKYYNEYVNYPGYPKQFWMSETSGQQNTHEGAIRLVSGLSNALKFGKLNAWVFWTISGETFDPYHPDQTQNLMLNGIKLKKYYVSKNYYRYVRPGARVVESSSSDIDVLVNAFWHEENNSMTYVLINKSSTDKIVNFDSYDMATDTHLARTSATENCQDIPIPAGSESFSLPPMSVSTFILSGGEYNNHPPTIENVQDTILVGSPDSLAITLHGISDGDPDKDQELEVSASFDNSDVIDRISLEEYTGTDSVRLVLYFNKGISGENITTVLLTENDTANTNEFMPATRMNFSTWVINYINQPPYFNELDTAYIELSKGQQVINLTGVTDGNEEVKEELDVEFWAVHDRYFDFDSLVYEQGDSNIYIWVTPERLGAAIAKVSITDNGETIFGENFFEDDFFIKVLDAGVSTDDLQYPRISLFPNPADQTLILGNVVDYRRFSVINLSGRQMEIGLITGDALYLDTESYPAGIYYIKLAAVDRFKVYKFIVSH